MNKQSHHKIWVQENQYNHKIHKQQDNKTRRHRHEHTRHTEENQLPEPTRNKNEVDVVTRPTEPYRVKPKNYQYV